VPVPQFEGKYGRRSLVEPPDFVAHIRGLDPDAPSGEPSIYAAGSKVPPSAILLYQKGVARRVAERYPSDTYRFACDLWVLRDHPVAVASGFGVGAPSMALVVEELIAIGVRRIVGIGTAGVLAPRIGIGEAIVCTSAIRDEGVSHHYLEPREPVRPSLAMFKGLSRALGQAGIRHHQGPTWTIDAPYRETVDEARHYRQQGVLTVDMEAAALFAVAAFRSVEAAALFIASDSLADLSWVPRFTDPAVDRGLDAAFGAALTALTIAEN